jgi:hypothetical protein
VNHQNEQQYCEFELQPLKIETRTLEIDFRLR